MSRRQARRELGAVRRLPPGRYQARLRLPDGRFLPAPRTFATKTDASLWLDNVRVERASGLDNDPSRARLSLRTYATTWLAQHTRISPRTREIYDAQLRLHVLPAIDPAVPALGDTALGDLRPKLIRSWYLALRQERSPSTAAKAYVRLRQILRQAVDDDRLVKNPCDIRRGGVERHGDQRFATMDQ